MGPGVTKVTRALSPQSLKESREMGPGQRAMPLVGCWPWQEPVLPTAVPLWYVVTGEGGVESGFAVVVQAGSSLQNKEAMEQRGVLDSPAPKAPPCLHFAKLCPFLLTFFGNTRV